MLGTSPIKNLGQGGKEKTALEKLRGADEKLQRTATNMLEEVQGWMSEYVNGEASQHGGTLTTLKWAYVLGVSVNTAKALLCGRRVVQMEHVCRMAAYNGQKVMVEMARIENRE